MKVTLSSLLYADLERLDFYSNRAGAPKTLLRLLVAAWSPRFAPVVLYRLSHYFSSRGVGVLAKFFSSLNFTFFGLEIASKCEIGPGLFFPHTVGTVIGAEHIGMNAVIYHNVTIGAQEIDVAYSQDKRPIIGNDVLIGSGAKVLGGLQVGDRVKIGANAVVLKSIPNDSLAVGVPAVSRSRTE